MALKITCPHCSSPRRLHSPYPLPGAEVHCLQCGRLLSISYPPGMVEKLRQRGAQFVGPSAPTPAPLARQGPIADPAATRIPGPAAPLDGRTLRPAPPAPVPAPRSSAPPPPPPQPAPRVPPIPGPAAQAGAPSPWPTAAPSAPPVVTRTISPAGTPAGKPPAPAPRAAAPPSPPQGPPRKPAPPAKKADKPPRKRSLLGRMVRAVALLAVMAVLGGSAAVGGVLWYYSQDLPTVETLRTYRPPTVTVIYDRNGKLLGEIYEKRRYVVPLERVPKHVIDAFIAAEDANFWTHTGVDVEGIFRAIARNLAQGRKAQGASTITQQVARNFLLSSEKTYERKIREIILSRRVEETFTKEHILYLYMNQIYLGSGAYGVEAAARTYFGKHVEDLTLAEAAIIAGLPQRPSDYSPHRHWEKARGRQEYVLDQMLKKGYIDKATHDATLAEPVTVSVQPNEFLLQAPYFTEHIRRYLVETYGFDKVYNDGLEVRSTCDLDLQKTAQEAVIGGVMDADKDRGWRGAAQKLADAEIQPWLDQQEQALRQEIAQASLKVGPPGVGGYAALPDASALTEGRRYSAVVLEVESKHAIVGIGRHKAILPRSWMSWAHKVDPDRRIDTGSLDDVTRALGRGDVIEVILGNVRAQDADNLKGYAPAKGLAAVALYQAPELQGALFSYRLSDGAVLAMVGGVDFENSEYNRATQARRQVGSTFKPIVYAAAIASRRFTAGTMLQDAPTVFRTLGGKLWKPGNYGGDYLGNITLRRALQMSRNVCTVRVLEKMGLDPVYDLAGPKLKIGYNQPVCSRTHIPAADECPGTTTPSPVEGMVWCEHCDPTSCPLVEADNPRIWKNNAQIPVGDAKQCLDTPQEIDGQKWCRSCDVNLRVCDWLPRISIPSSDPCVDARRDEDGQVMCRVCDLSMGLGSSSLTMVELSRAYSAFATYGKLIEPHFIEQVVDRDGTVIEAYKPPDAWPEVLEPGVAGITHWLLEQVTAGGTASKAGKLGLHVAGKTGTTNDFYDAWFVGYNPDIIAATWVGMDQPQTMGSSYTGGKVALPIWMDYMAAAVPKDKNRDFPSLPGVSMVSIDENTGMVAHGGRAMPMLPGTAPTNVVGEVGQKTADDLLTSDF